MPRAEDIAKKIASLKEDLKYKDVYKRVKAIMYAYKETEWSRQIEKIYGINIDEFLSSNT